MLMAEKPQVTTREIHRVAEAKCCRVIAKHSLLQSNHWSIKVSREEKRQAQEVSDIPSPC